MFGSWESEGDGGNFSNVTDLNYIIVSETDKTTQTITVSSSSAQQ